MAKGGNQRDRLVVVIDANLGKTGMVEGRHGSQSREKSLHPVLNSRATGPVFAIVTNLSRRMVVGDVACIVAGLVYVHSVSAYGGAIVVLRLEIIVAFEDLTPVISTSGVVLICSICIPIINLPFP